MIINKEQLKEFFILFTYSNLKHEADYEEIKLEQVQKVFNYNEDIDSDTTANNIIIAIQNHKALYNNSENICNKYKGKLSIELIKEIHGILMKDLYRKEFECTDDKPGEFKRNNYTIGLFNVGTPAHEVEQKLQELFDEINAVKITEENVYKIVAYLHNWICWIHPFADGNGIVARFLINYLLLSSGFSPVIFGVERKEVCRYNSVLEKFDDMQEVCYMVDFIESYT